MTDDQDILALTTEIVASYAGNAANLRAEELPDLIRCVRAALKEADAPPPSEPEKTAKMTKAQWSKLITPGGIKSLIDGKMYSTLKRSLSRHGHTPDSYREAYGLPSDFLMVSPDYSAKRSEMAKSLGLGAKGRGKAGGKVAAKRSPKPKAATPSD